MNFKFYIIFILGKETLCPYLFWLKLTFIYLFILLNMRRLIFILLNMRRLIFIQV